MPLQRPQALPQIPSIDEIVPIAHRQITQNRKTIDAIIQGTDPSTACFDNKILPIANMENIQSGEQCVIQALRFAAPDKATQDAAEKAEKMWQDYEAEVDRRTDRYALVKAVKLKGEKLDSESEKYLNRLLLRFTQCGHGLLDGPGIQHWLNTDRKIKELCTEINRSIREFDGKISFTNEELNGLPPNELDLWPVGPDGKRQLSVNGHDFFVVEKYAHNPNTRKRMGVANSPRLHENAPLFKQVILLRDENARLLGFRSHAETRLPYRISNSIEWIESLLYKLKDSMLPYSRSNLKLLEETRVNYLATNAAVQTGEALESKIHSWDVIYYWRMIEEKAAVDHVRIAEYFPLRHTVSIMLELFSTYLKLHFSPIPKDEILGSIWSEDIEAWSVWDEKKTDGENFVGYLYADLLERPNKYKGNQCVNIQPVTRRSGHSFPCQVSQPPLASLQLGHGIHDLLARTKYKKFHGYRVCLEFGEAIGTMLDELKAMSCHYTRISPQYMEAWKEANPESPLPPKSIPDELLENLLKRRRFSRLSNYLYQIADSLFDLAVHNPATHEDLINLNEAKLYTDLLEQVKLWRLPEPSYLHASFGHLLAGYDAGYYAYVCANVFAEELFQKNFAEDHRSPEAWNKFRRGILEYGGSRDELEVLEEFLGRSPTPDALLQILGLFVVP
ncbi:metallopeptidase MepB [Hyaloscypha variabilis F]|uniref:Metallopeptidase MepB n=1 Tax=Hyaloscypha variabilis (strain UAMH 11265 / GT02V1 / F) TaxID=1149755 RepID=A0A2J6RLT3_HYAVF|nr:metallopeptidase MepB [Hyaloscypha variabilis F]